MDESSDLCALQNTLHDAFNSNNCHPLLFGWQGNYYRLAAKLGRLPDQRNYAVWRIFHPNASVVPYRDHRLGSIHFVSGMFSVRSRLGVDITPDSPYWDPTLQELAEILKNSPVYGEGRPAVLAAALDLLNDCAIAGLVGPARLRAKMAGLPAVPAIQTHEIPPASGLIRQRLVDGHPVSIYEQAAVVLAQMAFAV